MKYSLQKLWVTILDTCNLHNTAHQLCEKVQVLLTSGGLNPAHLCCRQIIYRLNHQQTIFRSKKKSQPISSIHASPKPCTKSVDCFAQRTAWPEWLPYYKAIHSALTSHVRCWVIVSPAYDPPLFKCCCCSVTQVCLTLCNPVDCSTSGFPVLHHLLELAQTHVHRVGDAIQPSHPPSSPSPPAFHLSQHQSLFQCVSSSHQVAKIL